MGVVMGSGVVDTSNAGVTACGVAIMAKGSVPGLTKTRLVPPLTFEQAAQCNTAFLRDVADNIIAAAAERSIAGYVAYGPAEARPFFQDNLPPEMALIEACYASLGECLDHTITQLLERGHSAAVVINADSPTLPTSLLLETADVLARPGDRAVLGPALDGGYYLLGLKVQHRRLFQSIAWSTEHVAQQTLERAAQENLPVHVLPTWYDVDDIATFKLLLGELFEGKSFAPALSSARARHTRALIEALLESSDFKNRLTLNGLGRAAE